MIGYLTIFWRFKLADWISAGNFRLAMDRKRELELECSILRRAAIDIVNLPSKRHNNPNKNFNREAMRLTREALQEVKEIYLP